MVGSAVEMNAWIGCLTLNVFKALVLVVTYVQINRYFSSSVHITFIFLINICCFVYKGQRLSQNVCLQFQKRKYAKMQWRPCGKKGYGLESLEDILTGKFIIEYIGEVNSWSYLNSTMNFFIAARQGQILSAYCHC